MPHLPTARELLPLAQIALALGQTHRATLHEDGVTPESVATHTVMLGLIAPVIAARLGDYDSGLVALYALVHDLVESVEGVGDTNTYQITEEDRRAKEEREWHGMTTLHARLLGFFELRILMNAYEAQGHPEARLVRYLDKLLPKLCHALNGCATIQALGSNDVEMAQAHDQQILRLAEQYPELHDTVGPLLADAMSLAWTAYPSGSEAQQGRRQP